MLLTQKQKSISIFFIMSYFLNKLKIYKLASAFFSVLFFKHYRFLVNVF
jgi:hypothetical protein